MTKPAHLRTLVLTTLALGLVPACYEGIDDAGSLDEFGDEQGETGLDDESTGESGDAGDTSGDPSDTSGDPSDTSTTSTSTTDTGTDTTSTTDSGTTETTTDTGEPMAGDMPDNAYCNPVDGWDAQWIAYELEVIELVNQARAQGGNCGAYGNKAPSGPLTWEPHLTCAARVHSLDMASKDYFDHTNLEGHDPGWRLGQAGYQGGGWGENIAAGYPSPSDAVQGWLDSDGHCNNMLSGDFTTTGVGYAYDAGASYGAYWTQTFGN